MSGLSYSIHLGSDKNKKKSAKQVAKTTSSKTTSLSNNAIQNATGLSKVNKHNLRKYDNDQNLISIIYGTSNLFQDVQGLYKNEFESARLEYNNNKIREDRKINNYFEHISNNSNRDLACELIIELGDMDFWKDKSQEYRYKMKNVFKEQIENLTQIIPAFKIANATIHFDETSPHLHIVGVPIKDGYKNGMKKQVGKSLIFTKETLAHIQDKMRIHCINSFNKYYETNYELKEKAVGRNQDISLVDMKDYRALKKQQEKNQVRLKEANAKTDLLNDKTKGIENLINNLKIARFQKNNFLISDSDVGILNDYIHNVKTTTKSVKSVNDLTVIMKKYEETLITHNNDIYDLTTTIENKDSEITRLSSELKQANGLIIKLKEKVNFLQEQVNKFKGLWLRLTKFFQTKILFKNDKEYSKVIDELHENGIFTKDEKDHIKYGRSIKNNENSKNERSK